MVFNEPIDGRPYELLVTKEVDKGAEDGIGLDVLLDDLDDF